MNIMQGYRGLIVGIANQRSLAYGIAQAAHAAGAQLWLTYQNERLREGVEALAHGLGDARVQVCDLSDDAALHNLIAAITQTWGKLDFVVHAVAAAKREELTGRFIDTSREGFTFALDTSVYSLVALAKATEALLREGTTPSILTLSYMGSTRVVPHYNIMGVAKAALESAVRYLAADMGPYGIRVNALRAGPIKTLSAAGVRGLRSMLAQVAHDAPLKRNVAIDDVGNAALFALSHLGQGMTGEVFHVDAGYHCLGAPSLQEEKNTDG